MAFFTILGVAEILCSFRLALEWKIGKEIPDSLKLEFLEKFSGNNFALSDVGEHFQGIADSPLLRTLLTIHQTSQEPSFREVMDSCFFSICKFSSFNKAFARITSLSELPFRFRRFILLVQMKKMISMNYTAAQAAENHDNEEKEVRLSEIKPVKNISKNLQSFLEVSHKQKEIFLSHKLQDHTHE